MMINLLRTGVGVVEVWKVLTEADLEEFTVCRGEPLSLVYIFDRTCHVPGTHYSGLLEGRVVLERHSLCLQSHQITWKDI